MVENHPFRATNYVGLNTEFFRVFVAMTHGAHAHLLTNSYGRQARRVY